MRHRRGDAGLEVAKLLIDKGSAIEHQDQQGATALLYACLNSNVEVVKLLLERGANQHVVCNGCDAKTTVERYTAVRKEELFALLARHA